MKKNILIRLTAIMLFAIALSSNVMAQSVPQQINFQAIARDASNNLITNKTVQVRLGIIDNSTSTTVYEEYQQPPTDNFGYFTINLNDLAKSIPNGNYGKFSDIPWEKGDMTLKIEYQAVPGDPYVLIGLMKYTTVPYAMVSKTTLGVNKMKLTGANDGEVLKYKSSTGQWEPGTDNSGSGGTNYTAGAGINITGNTISATNLIPAGTIIPFAGSNVPQGWMLCDGSPISRSVYKDLFDAILISWGSGDGTSTFNIPDLRGMFLRGADHGKGRDPEASSRTKFPGASSGNTGDNVGSYQADDFKSHIHTSMVPQGSGSGIAAAGGSSAQGWTNTTPTGGTETRPKNAYVNYIIKL